MSTASTQLPEGRYGRSADERADRKLKIIGSVLGVALLVLVGWFAYYYVGGNKISAEFAYTVKQQVTLDKFRFMLAIAAPHSTYRVGGSLALGPQGHRCTVQKDDFQATWQETEVVSEDPTYRTNYGKIHYLQHLVRDHPLIMRPGQTYRLAVNFEPDVVQVEG